MKFSTPRFKSKRKKLIKLLIKYKDNEDKYVSYFKQLQELYYKYKIVGFVPKKTPSWNEHKGVKR